MAKKAFKKILTLCYEEEFPELHNELLSIEVEINKTKDFQQGIEDIYSIIPLYTGDDFPSDVMQKIEEIYEDFLEF